jgi:hypothetical protein
MNRRLHESQAKAPPPLDAEEKARLREQWSADKGQRQITRLAQQPVFARTPRPHLATMALHDQPTEIGAAINAKMTEAEPRGKCGLCKCTFDSGDKIELAQDGGFGWVHANVDFCEVNILTRKATREAASVSIEEPIGIWHDTVFDAVIVASIIGTLVTLWAILTLCGGGK